MKSYEKVVKAIDLASCSVMDASFELMRAVNHDGNYHPMNDKELAFTKKLLAIHKRIMKLREEIDL